MSCIKKNIIERIKPNFKNSNICNLKKVENSNNTLMILAAIHLNNSKHKTKPTFMNKSDFELGGRNVNAAVQKQKTKNTLGTRIFLKFICHINSVVEEYVAIGIIYV